MGDPVPIYPKLWAKSGDKTSENMIFPSGIIDKCVRSEGEPLFKSYLLRNHTWLLIPKCYFFSSREKVHFVICF